MARREGVERPQEEKGQAGHVEPAEECLAQYLFEAVHAVPHKLVKPRKLTGAFSVCRAEGT